MLPGQLFPAFFYQKNYMFRFYFVNSYRHENTKMKIFSKNLFFFIFLTFLQNIDCGYTLELLRRGGYNEYPQSVFWSKNKKNRYSPAYPSFSYIQVGCEGLHIARTCFPDEQKWISHYTYL